MAITLCRCFYFNAAHRLFNPKWDSEKNFEVFGKCSNPNFHGHNYDLIIKISGEINPDTGFVFNIEELKKIVDREIIEKLDHKNLNVDVEEFKDKIPSVENIAIYIWNTLSPFISENKKLSLVLYETPRNFVEYCGN